MVARLLFLAILAVGGVGGGIQPGAGRGNIANPVAELFASLPAKDGVAKAAENLLALLKRARKASVSAVASPVTSSILGSWG